MRGSSARFACRSCMRSCTRVKRALGLDEVRFCFFFQAEDGIRDYKVTGVQTCALPISGLLRVGEGAWARHVRHPEVLGRGTEEGASGLERNVIAAPIAEPRPKGDHTCKIGRASCRERV